MEYHVHELIMMHLIHWIMTDKLKVLGNSEMAALLTSLAKSMKG